jgi:hypothetical protein
MLSTHSFDSHSSSEVHGFPSGCAPVTNIRRIVTTKAVSSQIRTCVIGASISG